MNTKFIASSLIAVAAFASSVAFAGDFSTNNSRTLPAAGEFSGVTVQTAGSTLSRADVQANFSMAMKQGTLPAAGEFSGIEIQAKNSTLSRADVNAQTVQWVRAHGVSNSEMM